MLILRFYETANGRVPVEDFIKTLQKNEAAQLVYDLRGVSNEFPNVKRVRVSHLRGKLWEIKIRLAKKNFRFIYAVEGKHLVILHGFIKKKGRAQDEIKTAENRFKDYKNRVGRKESKETL